MWHKVAIFACNRPVIQTIAPIGPLSKLRYTLPTSLRHRHDLESTYESGTKSLLTLLNLEKIEEGLFRGQSEDLGLRQVFGGQVVGQALYAAKETVPEERLVHSFHSYFLRLAIAKNR